MTKHQTRRHRLAVSTTFAAAVLLSASMVGAKGIVVTAHSDGLYDGDEWSDLLRSVATVVVVLLSSDDDIDDDHDDILCDPHGHHWHHARDDWCDDLGISIPQVQFSAGMGYALTPRLTIGGRYLYRHDLRHNDIARLWGGGPEATYLLNGPGALRSFVGAYMLFAQGQRRLDSRTLAKGLSVGVRAGLQVTMSSGVGLLLQSGFQHDHFARNIDGPLQSRGATLGLGLRVELDE